MIKKKKGEKFLVFLMFLFSSVCVYAEESFFSVKVSLQKPSYVLDWTDITIIEGTILNCDDTKEECKINFDFRNSFIWDLKEKDFVCNTDFWFITWEENKCNPSTITFPKWEYNIKVYINNKTDLSKKESLNFKVINNSSLKPKFVYHEIEKPIISVQSWLDSNFKSYKDIQKVNFIYNQIDWNLTCLWDFWEWIFKKGDNMKCNPSYVEFALWEHNISLKVCDKLDSLNCKNTEIKIWILGQIKKSKKAAVNSNKKPKTEKIKSLKEDNTTNLNKVTDNNKEEKINIYKTWNPFVKYAFLFIILLILMGAFFYLRKYNND